MWRFGVRSWLHLQGFQRAFRHIFQTIAVFFSLVGGILQRRPLPHTVAWKWNESGFRPPLCTYRLNWARRTSWGWWDDWDDTVLQTQDSKFEPWRSEAEHATSRSRRLPTILTYSRLEGLQICGQSLTATGRSRQDTSTVAGFQIQDVESMSV